MTLFRIYFYNITGIREMYFYVILNACASAFHDIGIIYIKLCPSEDYFMSNFYLYTLRRQNERRNSSKVRFDYRTMFRASTSTLKAGMSGIQTDEKFRVINQIALLGQNRTQERKKILAFICQSYNRVSNRWYGAFMAKREEVQHFELEVLDFSKFSIDWSAHL